MYSVSKEMKLVSYQTVTPADNQTDFKSGQIIRFTIPKSAGYFDAHLSRLQFHVKTSGATYKYCFNSPTAGIASMIDMVRLSAGGQVISEVTDYNQLQHFVKCYENCLSVAQKDALDRGVCDYIITSNTKAKAQTDGCLFGQGLNRTGDVSATDMQQDVKFSMSLDFVSLFEHMSVVPALSIGDMLLEIRLAQSDFEIMKIHPATSVAQTCDAVSTGDSSIVIKPPFTGFQNLADSPYLIGLDLNTTGATADYEITSLSQAAKTGAITIGLNATIVAGDNGDTTVTVVKDTAGNANPATNPEFIVSKAELLLQIVRPPDAYVADQAQQVASGGMMLDVPSVTTYRGTVLATIKNQTLTLPTTQSRATAFFSVLRNGAQTTSFRLDNSQDFDYSGLHDDLRFYRSQIDGTYYPNQPVDLSQFIGGFHYSQEHHRELMKAFDGAGIPMRTSNGLKQCFAIGRTLSHMGSSTDLTATPIQIYLEYLDNTKPAAVRDAISYVFHKTRVAITSEGIMVMN